MTKLGLYGVLTAAALVMAAPAMAEEALNAPAIDSVEAPAPADWEQQKQKMKKQMQERRKKHGNKLSKIDKNGDGEITWKEFEAMSKERFAKMDANSDGRVTAEEMKAHHQTMKKKHKGEYGKKGQGQGKGQGKGQGPSGQSD